MPRHQDVFVWEAAEPSVSQTGQRRCGPAIATRISQYLPLWTQWILDSNLNWHLINSLSKGFTFILSVILFNCLNILLSLVNELIISYIPWSWLIAGQLLSIHPSVLLTSTLTNLDILCLILNYQDRAQRKASAELIQRRRKPILDFFPSLMQQSHKEVKPIGTDGYTPVRYTHSWINLFFR